MLDRALNHLVREIVDNPDEVSVTVVDTPRGELLEVRVHPDDLGRVIGRAGRTAKALRTLVNALADGRKVRVDVVDTDSYCLLAPRPLHLGRRQSNSASHAWSEPTG